MRQTDEHIELHPIVIGGEETLTQARYNVRHVPRLARGAYGENILRRLAGMSAPFGTRIHIENGLGLIRNAQA